MGEFDHLDFGVSSSNSGGSKMRIIRLAVMLVLLIGSAAAGGLLGNFLGNKEDQAPTAQVPEEVPLELGAPEYTYYEDFPAITVTLNEPRGDRFLKAAVLFKIRTADFPQSQQLIERDKRELVGWTIRTLSDLRIEDVKGEKNINRILRQLEESFNQKLWPDSRGRIQQVIVKDWAIQ